MRVLSILASSFLLLRSCDVAGKNTSAAFVSAGGGVSVGASSSGSTITRASSDENINMTTSTETIDPEYPGTAVGRMLAARARVKELAESSDKPLNGPWEEVRRKILWAGGLRDLTNARPGQGYTGHAFQDYNHVDLTTMRMDVSSNENDGRVAGIALGNQLGPGIKIASLPELGPGGSWSTCAMGCNQEPPRDVAHLQFQSRIAFKLVWVPPEFAQFVVVDDAGDFLAAGSPTGMLPHLRERQMNYRLVQGSKYATQADILGHLVAQRRYGVQL